MGVSLLDEQPAIIWWYIRNLHKKLSLETPVAIRLLLHCMLYNARRKKCRLDQAISLVIFPGFREAGTKVVSQKKSV